MDPWIDRLNEIAARWAAWVAAGTLEAAALLAVVGVAWLALHRRAAPQVGYGLFLLVPLKLLVPPVVAIPLPAGLAAWSPSGLVRGPEARPITPGPAVAAAPPPSIDRTSSSAVARHTEPGAGRPPSVAPIRAAVGAPDSAGAVLVRVESAGHRPGVRAGLMVAWLAAVVGLLGRQMARQVRFRAHLGRLAEVDPALFPVDLDALARRAGVGRRVRFLVDPALRSPVVWGVFRPTVVVPIALPGGLEPAQLRWVLLHELAHVRRHDLAAVAVQRLAGIVNFFNPVVWIANRLVDQAREYACDDLAEALGEASSVEAGGAFVAILRRASGPRRPLDGALGVIGLDTRAACLRRVARLLDADRPVRVALGWPTRLALLAAALGALPHVRAATTAAPPPAPAGPTRTDPDEPLKPGGDFELTVVGPGARPVPGALVEFRADPRPEPRRVRRGEVVDRRAFGTVVRADDAGRITVHYPEVPRDLDLSIITPGFGPYLAAWYSHQHVEVIPARFTAELDAAWTVGGLVVDPDGRPVAGAEVQPSITFKQRPDTNRQLGVGNRLTTDAAGRWHFASVPGGLSEVLVSIDTRTFRPFLSTLARNRYEVAPGAGPATPIALEPGVTVVGAVLDDRGRPIVGATVRAKFLHEVRRATTGPDGRYRLDGCDARSTRIVVSAPGKAIDMREITVGPGLEPVNFVMDPGGKVRIRVLSPEGKPEAGARIFFQKWGDRPLEYFEFDEINQFASTDGTWAWDEAPLDGFAADICPRGGDSAMQLFGQPIIPRAEEYVFKLRPALVVSGRVVDAETKEPIRRLRVVPGGRRPGGEWPHWSDREGFDAADGRFLVRENRVDGTFLVRVEAEGYEAATSRDIRADEGSVAVDFALKRGKGVSLQLLTPAGEPAVDAKAALGIEGAQIDLQDGALNPGSTFADVRTADAAGRVHFPVRDRPFLLAVVHPTGYARVDLAGAMEAARPVRLEPWASVEGTFRIGDRPAATVRLTLHSTGLSPYGPAAPNVITRWQTTTDAVGRYRFDRVIAGDVWIQRDNAIVLGQGAAEMSSSFSSRAHLEGGRVNRFDFGGTGRAAVGRFAMPPGGQDPADWSFLRVRGSPAAAGDHNHAVHFTATVGRDGTFRVDDLPDGQYAISVRMQNEPNERLVRHVFVIPAGDPADPQIPVDLGTITLPGPAPER